jgi:ubiquinone/menaquinone biosynthesis C-methylase UbiE
MREIFPREFAANPEPFTGERLTASVHGQIEIEHYHRYLYARTFCRERDVLDVASGEGYGAAQLAHVARHVVGVEYSGATARNAAMNFARENLSLVQADARSLPLSENSMDVVTSFETIEHFDRQEDFVAEVHRVLRPNGCFIVSTPDREVYSPPGSPTNPFHVHEFDRAEFLDLLHRYFRYVTLVRQRPMVISGMFPEEPASISPVIFEWADDRSFASDMTLPNAPYLIAIASELAPRLAPVSLLIERSDGSSVSAGDLQRELAISRKAEATARDAVATANKNAELSAEEARAAAEKLAHIRAALVQANTELERISGSLLRFSAQYIRRVARRLFR